jgi:hypothetical protein
VKITRKSARRLTSLAALGTGAFALSTEQAKADVVYVNLSSNPGEVGFDGGFASSFRIPLPHGAAVTFLTNVNTSSLPKSVRSVKSVYARGNGGKPGAWLAVRTRTSSLLALFNKGAAGSTSTVRPAKSALLDARTFFTNGQTQTFGLGSFKDQYALFKFPQYPFNGQFDFGWILLSESVAGGSTPESLGPASTTGGPDLSILGYAYDTSGNPLPAGDTGTPEPSTFELTGLAALALGAAGVRRWRVARRKAA